MQRARTIHNCHCADAGNGHNLRMNNVVIGLDLEFYLLGLLIIVCDGSVRLLVTNCPRNDSFISYFHTFWAHYHKRALSTLFGGWPRREIIPLVFRKDSKSADRIQNIFADLHLISAK